MVTLYSTHCPKCRIIEMKLAQLGIEHQIIDDLDTVVKVGQDQHILSAPILEADGKFMNFQDAVKFINERK